MRTTNINSIALDSLRKLIIQKVAVLEGPTLSDTAPGVLIATISSRAAAARLEWEKLHHHSVPVDKERLASDTLLTQLLDQKLKNKFSLVSLHHLQKSIPSFLPLQGSNHESLPSLIVQLV